MKKRLFIPACILTVVAVVFIIYSLNHPEMSFPWNIKYNGVIYGIYVVITVLLYSLAFTKLHEWGTMDLVVLILELGSIFFIILSFTRLTSDGDSNWYLPLGIALNVVAMCINAKNQKNKADSPSNKENQNM